MGYMFPDGSPDNLKDALLSSRIFVVALSAVLEDNVGIAVELIEQPNFTDDPFGKYIVYKDGDQIKFMSLPNDAEIQSGEYVRMTDSD